MYTPEDIWAHFSVSQGSRHMSFICFWSVLARLFAVLESLSSRESAGYPSTSSTAKPKQIRVEWKRTHDICREGTYEGGQSVISNPVVVVTPVYPMSCGSKIATEYARMLL